MKKWLVGNKLLMAGILLGAMGGYCYYHFIGCSNGTCMIGSKPLNSVLYFGVMGGLFSGLLKKNV
jgi:phage shock protein E